ncbi:hypothetical protein MMC07_009004 [Pseudocyphellaria aurata]|nr:hypothetical protein [Pseudocyphellaria aurata]
MPHSKSESNETGASLPWSSPSSSSDNLNAIEMQNMERQSRHRQAWLRWPQYSKAASFPWIRPRYYLTALGIIMVLTALLLLRQHKYALAVKLHAIQLEKLIPSAPPSESVPTVESSQPITHTELSDHSSATFHNESSARTWVKPDGVKIIALIFYGRPETVSILDCYMKQNLVSNGGFLDEVHWAVNTDKDNALKYLDGLIESSEEYQKIVLPGLGFDSVWEHAVTRGNLYIKIDDDIVYVHEDAIPNLIYTKLKHPDAFGASANLINSPSLSWLHYHLGAIHAYLPETKAPDSPQDPDTWRASSLPTWEGDNISFPLGLGTNNDGLVDPHDPGAPPFKGHRWLPLRDRKNSLMRTPISQTEFDAYGGGWKSWAIAAQQHYSLLQNIEANEMDRYHFGRSTDEYESIYTMGDSRMNINFLCIWGDDVVDNFPFPDIDEPALSWKLPQKLQRPYLINTKASVAHFTFMTQHDLFATDLLDRYRAYANEMVCTEKIKPI